MSDANVLKEQQPYNYSTLIAVLQAHRWETPKLRIVNLSRDIVCLLTQGRTLPYQTKLPLDLCSTLSSAYEHQRSGLLITLRDRIEAPHHAPNDCSAYARSHSLYSRTAAVSPRYVDPFLTLYMLATTASFP
jgi:hypothetical protein